MTDRAKLVAQLAQARAHLYRFLGSIYILEVDEDMLNRIKALEFPADQADPDLQEGYGLIRGWAADKGAADLEDLAADYAKIFLAAGDAQGLAAFPYESVYTGKRHQIMGDAQQEVRALFAARGWEPKKDMYRIMEDHIGLELEYMAILCEELTQAAEGGQTEAVQSLLTEQRAFVERHLINWALAFAGDVYKYAQSDFYKGIARVTAGFLKQERDLLQMGGAVWDIA